MEAIALAHATPEARAFAALRLVQDELRYVSLSVGAGGYFARSPVEVIAARTGKLVLQGGGKGHHTDRAVAVALAYLQTERLQKSYVGIGKVRGYW